MGYATIDFKITLLVIKLYVFASVQSFACDSESRPSRRIPRERVRINSGDWQQDPRWANPVCDDEIEYPESPNDRTAPCTESKKTIELMIRSEFKEEYTGSWQCDLSKTVGDFIGELKDSNLLDESESPRVFLIKDQSSMALNFTAKLSAYIPRNSPSRCGMPLITIGFQPERGEGYLPQEFPSFPSFPNYPYDLARGVRNYPPFPVNDPREQRYSAEFRLPGAHRNSVLSWSCNPEHSLREMLGQFITKTGVLNHGQYVIAVKRRGQRDLALLDQQSKVGHVFGGQENGVFHIQTAPFKPRGNGFLSCLQRY